MWSDLPTDLLLLISETLTLRDLIFFSSVCRSWRSAAVVKDRHPYCQAPWLMFTGRKDSSAANFYSISDNKIFTIPGQPGPPVANRICIGSAHGWLITADERSKLSLLNPLTLQHIDLPHVSTFDHIRPCRCDPGDGRITHYYLKSYDTRVRDLLKYTAESLRFSLYMKATVWPSLSAGRDYTVVLLLYQPDCLAFARSGDERWTMTSDDCCRKDLVYHGYGDGKVYTTNWSGEVEVWDFSRKDGRLPKRTVFIPRPDLDGIEVPYVWYFVPTPWGDLLHIRRERGGLACDNGCIMTSMIGVHRVDFRTRKLVQVKSLGNYSLFVGDNLSTCISAEVAPNVKGNCVYFTDDSLEYSHFSMDCRRDIGIFNLEDGSIELILPGNPRLHWPPPIWLTPTFL